MATSLGKCNERQSDLRVEFDATSEAMQVVTDTGAQVEFLTDPPHHGRVGHHKVQGHPQRLQNAGGGGLPGRGGY